MCSGSRGEDTASWVEAAGMRNYETLYQTCKLQLLDENFQWLDDVEEVDFGWREPVRRPGR